MRLILYLALFILIQWLLPWWTLAILVGLYAFGGAAQNSFFRNGMESMIVPLGVHLAVILLSDASAGGRISQRLSELFQSHHYGAYLLTLGVTFVIAFLSFLTGHSLRKAVK